MTAARIGLLAAGAYQPARGRCSAMRVTEAFTASSRRAGCRLSPRRPASLRDRHARQRPAGLLRLERRGRRVRPERRLATAAAQRRTRAPIKHLGLDADWFPLQSRLLTTDGVRLVTSSSTPGFGPVRRRRLAIGLARVYLGPPHDPPGYLDLEPLLLEVELALDPAHHVGADLALVAQPDQLRALDGVDLVHQSLVGERALLDAVRRPRSCRRGPRTAASETGRALGPARSCRRGSTPRPRARRPGRARPWRSPASP